MSLAPLFFNRLLLAGGVMIGLWLIAPAALAQERYSLTVQPTPTDSRVRILNSRLSYRPGIRLPPGAYHLEIRHEGYQTVQQWVYLRNQPLTVAVTLPPLESPAPPVVVSETQSPPAAASVQSAQPESPPAAVPPRTETKALPDDKPRITDPALAAALQSGDLQPWRVIFATPPPNTEWLAALRASPLYWLLSPMTWFWLLLIWTVLIYGPSGWRLSTFGGLGLLSLILALPIGWLFYWTLWAGFIALLVGLVILWAAPSLPGLSKKPVATIIGAAIVTGIVAATVAASGAAGGAAGGIFAGIVMGIIAAIVAGMIVAGIGTGIGAGIGILYLHSNFWNYHFYTTALDSLLLIGVVLLVWLVLSIMSVLLSARFLPWLKASQQAAHRLCQSDYHRFRLGPDLPWPVRWSGRLLMEEVPRQHQDFADYFVCRYCGQRYFVTTQHVVGVIGVTRPLSPRLLAIPPKHWNKRETRFFVSLWSEAEKTARNADIDRLEIREGNVENYERAVNAVINVLKNDVSRPANYLKKVPVIVTGTPALSPGAQRLLRDTFKSLQVHPRLESYPHLLCSHCGLRAKRRSVRVGWLRWKTVVACRGCGVLAGLVPGVRHVVGVISGTGADFEQAGNTVHIRLWSEADLTARNADIDRLEIREGKVENYERAVNAVINVLKNDVSRPANYLKKIPVIVTGTPALSPGAQRLLRDTFKSLQEQGGAMPVS